MGAHRAGGRLRPVDARGRSPAAGAVDSNGFILPARARASHISLSGRGVCRRAGRPRSTAGAGARRGRGGGGERRGRGGGETKACVYADVSLGRPPARQWRPCTPLSRPALPALSISCLLAATSAAAARRLRAPGRHPPAPGTPRLADTACFVLSRGRCPASRGTTAASQDRRPIRKRGRTAPPSLFHGAGAPAVVPTQ